MATEYVEMLAAMGTAFQPVADLIQVPQEYQFTALISYPQLFVESRNSLLLLMEAGFTLKNLQQMGIAAEVLLACVQPDQEDWDVAQLPKDTQEIPRGEHLDPKQDGIISTYPSQDVLSEEGVHISVYPEQNSEESKGVPANLSATVADTAASDKLENARILEELAEDIASPKVSTEAGVIASPKDFKDPYGSEPMSCSESVSSVEQEGRFQSTTLQRRDEPLKISPQETQHSNVLPSPIFSDMEIEDDASMIFTVAASTINSVDGSHLDFEKPSSNHYETRQHPAPSFYGNAKPTYRPVASDFNQYNVFRASKKFIPDDFRPIIIELSDDDDDAVQKTPPSTNAKKDLQNLEEEMKRFKAMIALKEGAANKSTGIRDSAQARIKASPGIPAEGKAKAIPKRSPEEVQPQQISKPVNPVSKPNASLFLLRKKLTEEIASDEVLLESALKDILTKETSMITLTEKIGASKQQLFEKEAALQLLEEEMSLLKAKIEEAKTRVDSAREVYTDTSSQLNNLKKTVIAKGNMASELRSAINKKRMSLLELSKPMFPKSKEITSKRKRGISEDSALKLQKGAASTPKKKDAVSAPSKPNGNDFISFDSGSPPAAKVVKMQSGLDAEIEAKKSDVHRRESLSTIIWGEKKTVEVLFELGGVLAKKDELCSVTDFRRLPAASKPVVSLPKKAKEVGIFLTIYFAYTLFPQETSGQILPSAFQPYRSISKDFFVKTEVKPGEARTSSSAGVSKIDPMKKFCLFEMQGGICNDKTCLSQHIRDVIPTGEKAKSNSLYLQTSTKPKYSQPDKLSKPGSDVLTSNEIKNLSQLRIPILVDGIWRLLLGEDSKVERYHNSGLSEDDYKEALKRRPRNVETRLLYAIDVLPSPLTVDALVTPGAVKKSLAILAEGLEVSSNSEELWSLYLELYCRQGDIDSVREVFEQALQFLPASFEIWWRYYLCELELEKKEGILRRMIQAFTSSKLPIDVVSRSVLSATLQLTKLFMECELVDLAQTWLLTFLTASDMKTVISCDEPESILSVWERRAPVLNSASYNLLTPRDLCTAWLSFFHLTIFGRLPSEMFFNYPFDFIVCPAFFSISWELLETEEPITEADLTFGQIFDDLVFDWVNSLRESHHSAFLALLRNYFEFSVFVCNRSHEDIKETVGLISQSASKIRSEINFNYISVFKSSLVDEAELSIECCNLLAKGSLEADNLIEAAKYFTLGIRRCFRNPSEAFDIAFAEDAVASINDTLGHCRWLLGMNETYSLGPGLETCQDLTCYRKNIFIWMTLILLELWKNVELNGETDLVPLLSEAIQAVDSNQWRQQLWLELMKYQVLQVTRDGALRGSGLILSTLEDAMQALKEEDLSLVQVDTVFSQPPRYKQRHEGGRTLRPILLAGLKGLSKEGQSDLMDVLLQSRKEVIASCPEILTLESLGGALGSKDSIPGLLQIAKSFLPESSIIFTELGSGRFDNGDDSRLGDVISRRLDP
ncbi:Zinc finger C3H1 domain-containing protein [Dinochytrium kinnereticum]|nr:Zinc finger C3H1 domain-containing protein [Dinochytrium kinnereticum]